jgi:hypothetical protein
VHPLIYDEFGGFTAFSSASELVGRAAAVGRRECDVIGAVVLNLPVTAQFFAQLTRRFTSASFGSDSCATHW